MEEKKTAMIQGLKKLVTIKKEFWLFKKKFEKTRFLQIKSLWFISRRFHINISFILIFVSKSGTTTEQSRSLVYIIYSINYKGRARAQQVTVTIYSSCSQEPFISWKWEEEMMENCFSLYSKDVAIQKTFLFRKISDSIFSTQRQ